MDVPQCVNTTLRYEKLGKKVLRASVATWKSRQNTPVLRPNKIDNPDFKKKCFDSQEKFLNTLKTDLLAMHISEAGQSNFPMCIDVLICALVYVFHHVFLKQEGVVSSHGTGTVVKLLVIVANVRLPFGREKFVHVHFVTERHHDHDA